ncbi:WGR domain-containing protein [Deltaproteobacteria bacterium]|nr:WGR domain-containing protein [Deltaproteobacteria bacterium]
MAATKTPTVNASLARQLQRARRPWKIRLEYVGYNENNVGGRSNKFYEVSSTGGYGVTVRYGKIGSRGQTREYTFVKAMDKVSEKRNGGSRGNTPYRYIPGTVTEAAALNTPRPVLTGPFALIAALVPNGGMWDGYDKAGNFVMKLTPEGAQVIEMALA